MKKMALCIGNNLYKDETLGKLKCSVNDAQEIGEKLKKLGFSVTIKNDLDGKEMADAIGSAIDLLDDCDVFVLYYAGHGCQIEDANYLIPIDATWNDGIHAFKYSCIPLSESITSKLEKYPNLIKIIILDACRQFHNTRGNCEGKFGPFSCPSDSIIALSTSPGYCAKEDPEILHGMYTNILLRYIDMPHVKIETVFKRVRQDLVAETKGQQIPWEHTSLITDFYLNPHFSTDGTAYSADAYANSYRCINKNARTLVEKLMDGNFEIENSAINNIDKYCLDDMISDDLFFIGRSIFCSATNGYYPSFSAQRFIFDLFSNVSYIKHSTKIHILNGLAYQSYFGNNSNLLSATTYREHRELRLKIFDYLEFDICKESRNFVGNLLSTIEDRPIFIPGDERIQLSVQLNSSFGVENIYHNGRPLMAYMGEHIKSFDENFVKSISISDLKEKIATALNTRSNCIDLTFNTLISLDQKIMCYQLDFDLIY